MAKGERRKYCRVGTYFNLFGLVFCICRISQILINFTFCRIINSQCFIFSGGYFFLVLSKNCTKFSEQNAHTISSYTTCTYIFVHHHVCDAFMQSNNTRNISIANRPESRTYASNNSQSVLNTIHTIIK